MSDVDVIVLDLDGGPMLDDCLDSLAAQSLPPNNVIVFDNGSRNPTHLARNRELAEVVRSQVNLGFTGGVNQAFAMTRAPFVALVNNDVRLHPDWLRTVRDEMQFERVAAVQTVLRMPDLVTIDGAGIDISDGTFRQVGHGLRVGAALPEAWGVSATAALYRRSALGGRVFDDRFFAYYEDVELCARLHEQGWRTVVLPDALATHGGSRSASRLGKYATYLRTRNRYFVARLHPGVGSIAALLAEDAKLLPRGRSSLRGMIAGMVQRLERG